MTKFMPFYYYCCPLKLFIQNKLGGCVKTPNIKILNSLCVHLWMRNEFFIFL